MTPTLRRADGTREGHQVAEAEQQDVEGSRDWYHTIELPDGSVTPGLFDHRPVLDRYELPASLAGQRVLDVGTFDGHWAFLFERRGAEVVALDVPDKAAMDWPAQLRGGSMFDRGSTYTNFEMAHDALGSSVRRERLTVYEASPDRLGTFDLVFVGSLLVHLRDPVGALEALRSVCTGELRVVDAVDPWLDRLNRFLPAARLQCTTGRLEWWVPNRRALGDMVTAAGYVDVSVGPRFTVPFRASRGGVTHAMVRARPA